MAHEKGLRDALVTVFNKEDVVCVLFTKYMGSIVNGRGVPNDTFYISWSNLIQPDQRSTTM
ncbi:hypothetical protein ACF0H5_003222 [Mactra antiquata]